MSILVTYVSETGNTKKVAEAIYGEISTEKEIKPLQEVTSLDGYDATFIGFPIVRSGPGQDVKQFLSQHTAGKRIALFVTHASPEDRPELQQWLAPAKEAACDAELLGLFHCRGALAPQVKAYMLKMPDPQLRAWAEFDDSQGQPDATRLGLARAFAQEIVAKIG